MRFLPLALLALVLFETVFIVKPSFTQGRSLVTPSIHAQVTGDGSAEAIQAIRRTDSDIYRIEKTFDTLSLADSFYQDYMGVKSYQLHSKGMVDFFTGAGLIPPASAQQSPNYSNWLPNAGNRYMLNSLLGVKYVLSKTTLKWEGFELYGKSGALYIYKNNYALPFGIVQTRQVTQTMLAGMLVPNVEAANMIRDVALVNAVVLEQFDTRWGERFALDELLKQQEALVLKATAQLGEINVDYKTCLRKIDEQRQHLAATELDPGMVPLTPMQQQGLDARYAALPDAVTLRSLDGADRSVGKALGAEIEHLNREAGLCEKSIEATFAAFIAKWRGDADALDATLAAASDFFAKLARLETDGLPAHEQRFFELLQNQSNQNLAALSTYLNDARKAILERMELVNESLRQVPFNQSAQQTTYLHIEPSDRQLPDVREFKQDIQKALSNAWSDDPQFAEARFIALRRLVDKLSSQEPEQRRWREAVLDVRLHVEFIGREIDTAGVEVEVYQSGAGKSGGQRQKLATTCLAAALRYQLGGSDHGVPMYAPVVLDEAFDKADNEFTALAMNIFTNFGFQMIVATPLKSVMTLEPFIGGACFVDIRDRRVSGVLLIEYDAARQRLDLPEQTRTEAALEAAA